MAGGVYEKSWSGEYWGRDGAIALSKKRFLEHIYDNELPAGLSALSSTYYSAAGNALSRLKTSGLFAKPLWLTRALWCFLRAVMLSEELERLGGLDEMTSDQLDIRARILFKSRRYDKALVVTEKALSRFDLAADYRVYSDTRTDSIALLLMGRAEIYYAQGLRTLAPSELALQFAEWHGVRSTTRVRLLKSRSAILRRLGYERDADVTLREAFKIAAEHGLQDQITKLKGS